MDLDLPTIVKDYVGHQWLALALVLTLYIRRLLAADSKFPWSPSQAVRSVVSGICLALASGFVLRENGVSWGSSILAMIGAGGIGGVGDNLLSAVWGNSSTAPTWAKAIAFIWKDLSPSQAASSAKAVSLREQRGTWFAYVLGALLVVGAGAGTGGLIVATAGAVSACTPAQQAEIKDAVPEVLKDLQEGMSAQAIVSDISILFFGDAGPEYVAKAEDIVDAAILILKDTGVIPAQFPTLLEPANAVAAELGPEVAARRLARAAQGAMLLDVPMLTPTTPAVGPGPLPPISAAFGVRSVVDAGARR